jgi:serine/threonine-protein kinase
MLGHETSDPATETQRLGSAKTEVSGLTGLPQRPAAAVHIKESLTSLDALGGRMLNKRYTVGRKVGEGGFGAVYEGLQVATGRKVALKILHPHNVTDSTAVGRFRREAAACSQLRNPHTVTLYDFDETPDGVLYIAMELVQGQSLQQLQRSQGPLAPARVLTILHQIADALGEAHKIGIVHRDMKPENIMVETRDGEDFVKVLDFGIAKMVAGGPQKNMPALTAFGQTVGTVEFMSPEQLRGQALDGRSDIYGLGMMAYETLTGTLPFQSASTSVEIINFHLNTRPKPPSELDPALGIPTVVDSVFLKMVEKKPDDRHADTDALQRHIEKTLANLGPKSSHKKMWIYLGMALGAVVLGVVLAALFTG